MCIVVDTNTISRVFNPKNIEHKEFLPVFEWITQGRGKLVIGGTRFDMEIKKYGWFIPLLSQLSRMNKVLRISTKEVDIMEQKIQFETPPKNDFDDPHIVSLLALSQCKLVCSNDIRAYPYFAANNHYAKAHKPKIYSGIRNRALLNDGNICKLCKPLKRLTKQQLSIFNQITDAIKQ